MKKVFLAASENCPLKKWFTRFYHGGEHEQRISFATIKQYSLFKRLKSYV